MLAMGIGSIVGANMSGDWVDDRLHEWAKWYAEFLNWGYPPETPVHKMLHGPGRAGKPGPIIPKKLDKPESVKKVDGIIVRFDNLTKRAVHYCYVYSIYDYRQEGKEDRESVKVRLSEKLRVLLFARETGKRKSTYYARIEAVKENIRITA